MAKVIKSRTLAQFKESEKIQSLDLFRSKKGNLYCTNAGTGEFVGMCADDFDSSKAIMVFHMADEDSGESWLFIANGEPNKPLSSF